MPITRDCENCRTRFTRKVDSRKVTLYCSHKCADEARSNKAKWAAREGAKYGDFRKHFVMPDTQVKPDVPTEHLRWAGEYIKDQEPDTVIHMGDHWDMSSLSEYDRGKKSYEGRRYKADIVSGNTGMELIMRGIDKMKRRPRLVFLLGNHEDRITRAVESDAKMDGLMGFHDFNLRQHGWEVIDFRKVIKIDGVNYSHYFYNPYSGKPYSGQCMTMLKNIGESFTMGHRQGLDFATRELPTGTRQIGLVAGSFYQHDEGYKGPQGNGHWRGVVVKHEVRSGVYDPMFVSLDYLRRRYG